MITAGLKEVFKEASYLVLAFTIGLTILVFTTWLPNIGLVWQIVTSEIYFFDKVKILSALVASITTNFTIFSALSTAAIAGLFGVNISMLAYYTRRTLAMQGRRSGAAASAGGLATGMFAIGCAACGTIAISPALAFFGAGGLVGVLPFGGEEFAVFGILMLVISLRLLARRIAAPIVCTSITRIGV